MKTPFYYIFFGGIVFYSHQLLAQNKNDSFLKRQDTNIIKREPLKKLNQDTVNKEKIHFSVLTDTSLSQTKGAKNEQISNPIGSVNTISNKIDTTYDSTDLQIMNIKRLDSLALAKNRFINVKEKPVVMVEEQHAVSGKEFLFYILCIVLLILALFKTFFNGYFRNLFRVFFNTSLKQTQLSDQLEQARLPSFILNIFFTITAGIYIWLLFSLYPPPRVFSGKMLLPICILFFAVLYFLKFCLLKFMGWVADVHESTNSYIFAIFLVNKITGIFLVPIIIMLAFLNRQWLPVITPVSLMIIGLLFLSRYIKSYGAIERKIPLNLFHFIIYIAGAEIIPLMIIYKVAIDYLV